MKINIKAVAVGLMFALILLFIKNSYSYVLSRQIDAGLARVIEEGGAENLYIGSSMFRQGINIDVLNEKEENAFVLSYNGNQPAGELLQLEYLIDNGCVLEHVYIDMYAYSAVEEPWLDDNRLLFDTDLEFKVNYLNLIMQNERAGLGTVWELFVTSNNEQFLMWPLHRVLTGERYNNGGSNAWVSGTNEKDMANRKPPYPESIEINAGQKEAIIGIVNLCREHNIQLTFVETPKYQSVHENEKYISIMSEYVSLLEELQVEYVISDDTATAVGVVESEYALPYTFPNENANYYQDTIHLATEGSAVFSAVLANRKE